MANNPLKSDIDSIFKRLKAIPTNKVCFDCLAKNPTWSSVTYGVFICLDCSAVHRGLGVHLTFVRSTQLDTSWTWIQLRHMQLGGNANARTFFRQHNCTSTDTQQKYTSRAAQLYRQQIDQLVVKCMKTQPNTAILEGDQTLTADTKKEEADFFEKEFAEKVVPFNYTNNGVAPPPTTVSNPTLAPSPPLCATSLHSSNSHDPAAAPPPQPPRSHGIGARRPAGKLGSKKLGGMGAQRVKTDFSAIEAEAERNSASHTQQPQQPVNKEQNDAVLTSLQSAYENLGLANQREEQRLKRQDPKKAEQAQRLGMGLGMKTTVSHSVFGDMPSIVQEPAGGSAKVARQPSPPLHSYEDDYDTVIRFNSGIPKYKDSPFEDRSFTGRNTSGIDDLLSAKAASDKSSSASSSNWENDFEKVDMPKPSIGGSTKNGGPKISVSANYRYTPIEDKAAQDKFGNAKSISSDMFFQDAPEPSGEMHSSLTRFQGSNAISSADLFPEQQVRRGGSSMSAPDLDDVRESVRHGVTKVAGRLSNMANNVMASLQKK